MTGNVCHAGFYRAAKDAGIPHVGFSHGLLELRNALGWCCCQLARAALLSDNPVTRRFYGINLLESVNWTWGLSLIALTIAIHATGVVMMALVGLGSGSGWRPGTWFRHVILIVIGMVGAVGLLLAVLHGIEAAIWAAAYVWLGALDSPKDAILYSVDSMTTRGASGLMLQQHWRMMGALEAATACCCLVSARPTFSR